MREQWMTRRERVAWTVAGAAVLALALAAPSPSRARSWWRARTSAAVDTACDDLARAAQHLDDPVAVRRIAAALDHPVTAVRLAAVRAVGADNRAYFEIRCAARAELETDAAVRAEIARVLGRSVYADRRTRWLRLPLPSAATEDACGFEDVTLFAPVLRATADACSLAFSLPGPALGSELLRLDHWSADPAGATWTATVNGVHAVEIFSQPEPRCHDLPLRSGSLHEGRNVLRLVRAGGRGPLVIEALHLGRAAAH
jgi:hypothetical protein